MARRVALDSLGKGGGIRVCSPPLAPPGISSVIGLASAETARCWRASVVAGAMGWCAGSALRRSSTRRSKLPDSVANVAEGVRSEARRSGPV